MALHHALRELVAARGMQVVRDGEEFRGALDDYLGEREATVGELNLLVDAVRLGALRRVVDVLDAGAAPDAAIREAGAAMARDRGTDDPARSCWALSVLAFALGRVDEPTVQQFTAEAGTVGVPPTSAAGAAAGHTVNLPGQRGAPPPPPGSGPPPGPGGRPVPGGRTPTMPPPSGEPARGGPGRLGLVLLVALAAVVVLGLVAGGVYLVASGSDDESSDDDAAAEETDGGGEDSGGSADVVPPGDLVVPFNDDGDSRIYRVDAGTGEFVPLTAGPQDRLPAISPGRDLVAYLEGVPGEATVVYALDPRTRDKTRLFRDDGPCAFASRPAWSPDGSRLAVVCNLEDGTRTGIYLANATDDLPLDTGLEPVVSDGLTLGAPTWVSDDTFVYSANEDESGETAVLWSFTIGQGAPEQLTTSTDGYLTHPDWSEEAERLLFLDHAVPDSDFGTLMTADADLDDVEEIGLAQVAHPVWGPDGDLVAFTVLEGGEEVLATATLGDLEAYTVVPAGPRGEVGVPVWDSR